MLDRVANGDPTAAKDHRHHAGSVVASTAVVGDSLQQAGLEVLDLETRIAQPGQAEDHLADSENRAHRQREQVQVASCDVLTEVAWLN